MTDDPASRPSREPWLFLAACLVVAFVGQGARGLWETDEGRYAEPARLMLATGDWLVPRLQGRPHLTKPPGTYWAVAAGVAVFGKNAFGARFLLGAAFGLSGLLVRAIGKRTLGDAAGARAGWIWISMLYPFASAASLTTDMFHVTACLGGVACLVRARQSSPLAWLAGMGLCLGLASLFKGPVAWLPFAGFAIGAALWDRGTPRPRGWWAGAGFGTVLALVLGLGWFLWARENVPGAREQFAHETAGRITSPGDHEPHWIGWFVPILVAGVTPWWLPAARGVAGAFRDPVGRMLVLWAAVPFVVHSAVASKNWLYVVGVCAPLALLAARGSRRPESPWPARPALVLAWVALLVGLRWGASFVPTTKDMRVLNETIERADPTGRVPVTYLSGRELRGLSFYRDGDVVHLDTDRVKTGWGDADLEAWAAEHAARGEPWLLVTESGEDTDRVVRRYLGKAAREVARTPAVEITLDGATITARPGDAWRILRIEPRTKKEDGR